MTKCRAFRTRIVGRQKKPSFENSAFLFYLVGRERFERSTNGLKVRCSTG
ncbi:hypothetical protein [Neisseria meningitidis serogroup B]|uniref:Uncharacterized protein n=1 Tax=Neisseria meningitidis serogroup B TaxID=491 RepID=A0A0H5QC41_NEIMI|nr:hypothetical protein [Neisseria meningitidis serogroup B]